MNNTDGPTLLVIHSEGDRKRWRKQKERVRIAWLSGQPLPASLSHEVAHRTNCPDPSALETTLWLRQWADEHIGEITVKEALEYRGITLWWLVDMWMLAGRGLPGLPEIARILKRLSEAIKNVAPSKIVLLTPSATEDALIRALASHLGIVYSWRLPPWKRKWRRTGLRLGPKFLFWSWLGKLIIRAICTRWMNTNSPGSGDTAELLCNTSSSTLNLHDGTDRIVQPLVDRCLERQVKLLLLYSDGRPTLGLDSLARTPTNVRLWEAFLGLTQLWKTWRERNLIERRWRKEIPGEMFGVPAAVFLSDRVESLLSCRIPTALIVLRMSQQIVSVLKPKCIFVTDEYDMWGRALIVAARQAGIRTVGIQHGIIEENHEGYVHLEGEIAPDGREDSPFCPVPHVTAVYGSHSRSALRGAGKYPESIVRVTGSLPLERARTKVGSQKAARTKLGLPECGLLFAFFGSPSAVYPEDSDHVHALCWASQRFDQVNWVLKAHPLDSDGARRYRQISGQYNGRVQSFDNVDAFELLVAADIVASYNSTIAIDAVAFDRPSIQINLSGRPEVFPFVRNGLSVGVYSRTELVAFIESLLEQSPIENLIHRQRRLKDAIFAPIGSPSAEILALSELGYI
jgi:hypothetical protein